MRRAHFFWLLGWGISSQQQPARGRRDSILDHKGSVSFCWRSVFSPAMATLGKGRYIEQVIRGEEKD